MIEDRPFRILHVLGRLDRGGAETLVMDFYRKMDRTKIQFDFIIHTQDSCAYENEIISLGGKIHRIVRYNGKNHFEYVRQWKNFFCEYPEYSVIHGHIRSTGAIYLKIAKKYDRICIIHSHATGSRGNILERMVKNLLQLPIRYLADYYLACSPQAAEWLFGKRKGKDAKILKNAIDLEKYRNEDVARKEFRKGLFENNMVFGHVGSFSKAKNHIFIISVFEEILAIQKNAVLILVGDGELKNKIECEVRSRLLTEKVFFLGSRGDIPTILKGMDVFLFPSVFEGFGMAALEAQAAGLPTHVADTLPKEIKVTDLLHFHSLTDTPKVWAKTILATMQEIKRTDRVDVIKSQGYDIGDQATWLFGFYLEALP